MTRRTTALACPAGGRKGWRWAFSLCALCVLWGEDEVLGQLGLREGRAATAMHKIRTTRGTNVNTKKDIMIHHEDAHDNCILTPVMDSVSCDGIEASWPMGLVQVLTSDDGVTGHSSSPRS